MRTEHNYIRTFTGLKFWPLDPDPADLRILDIAHALSQICRFTGHTRDFYSVAQHSVLVARNVSVDLQLWGLLHDASEAYLTDLARPVKHSPAFESYRMLEDRLQRVIGLAFGLDGDQPTYVKAADTLLLHAELRDLMTGSDPRHKQIADAAGVPEIRPQRAGLAKASYLAELLALTKGRGLPASLFEGLKEAA